MVSDDDAEPQEAPSLAPWHDAQFALAVLAFAIASGRDDDPREPLWKKVLSQGRRG